LKLIRPILSFFKQLFFSALFFYALFALVVGFFFSFLFPWLYTWIIAASAFLGMLVLADLLSLFMKKGVSASRVSPEKLSNGDENPIQLFIGNTYNFRVRLEVIDEIPSQFQMRDFSIFKEIRSQGQAQLNYSIRPTERGNYAFGNIQLFVRSPIGIVVRRITQEAEAAAPVYPSFLEMRKYEFVAISNRLNEFGLKKIRRIGHNYEFEQIKEYVSGDDFRTINWKASARRNKWMVNQFQDERSQQIINVIDKGRVMKNPFDGLTLLDYAINTSLMLSNIAIKKDDKAGLITFDHTEVQQVKPDKKGRQMFKIQEALYKQQTEYLESDFEKLFSFVRKQVQQRSLLVLYTNFDTVSSMERHLKYLRSLAKYHLVVVVFFINTENQAFIQEESESLRDIYLKTIAEQFEHEKQLIADRLKNYGIMTVLSEPENLSINTLNKYLELKSRGLV